MAFNDFLKKAKETAQSAVNTAKDVASNTKSKYDEKRQQSAQIKAEKERINAEKNAEATAKTATILDTINSNTGDLFSFDKTQLITFTDEFYDKLYLPAHSVSASKIIFHPMEKKINKEAMKAFSNYNSENETPIWLIQGDKKQKVLLTSKYLYFKMSYDESGNFHCIGNVSIDNISSMEYKNDGGQYIFTCNGIEVFNSSNGMELDICSFAEYINRIRKRNFIITNEQIDALIKAKIGENILKIVREYIFDDELILYFAWGCDSLTAKDFVVCSDKQMVVLNREAFGLTKNVKQFYYEDVTSMATLQQTSGLLDLALTAAMNICDLEISVAGAKERLNTLFTYEAEKAVKVYRECRRVAKSPQQPQVIVQHTEPSKTQSDPLEQLEKLSKLKDIGVITEDEFNAKKADLLSQL